MKNRIVALALASAAVFAGCGDDPVLMPDGSQAPDAVQYVGEDIVSTFASDDLSELTDVAVTLCGDRGYTLSFDTGRGSSQRAVAVCRGTEVVQAEREPLTTEVRDYNDLAAVEAAGSDLCGARGYTVAFDTGRGSYGRAVVVCL